jgi:predicted alpha/beta hydrolase family esterase
MRHQVLILPGYGNSGPGHWQTLWQDEHKDWRRVNQRDWLRPVLSHWLETLNQAVENARHPVVLVAHSLAGPLVAHFALTPLSYKIAAALLVAPADVELSNDVRFNTRGFTPVPLAPLPFKTVVVASRNDPYLDLDRARTFARGWRASLVTMGACGHINAESGHGSWPEGQVLLKELMAAAKYDRTAPFYDPLPAQARPGDALSISPRSGCRFAAGNAKKSTKREHVPIQFNQDVL